jgi:hypothetical protein
LFGGEGDDSLFGGPGNDVLRGDEADLFDRLDGGGGVDFCFIDATDLRGQEGDTLQDSDTNCEECRLFFHDFD